VVLLTPEALALKRWRSWISLEGGEFLIDIACGGLMLLPE